MLAGCQHSACLAWAQVKAVLCAALYPNAAVIVMDEAAGIQRSLGFICFSILAVKDVGFHQRTWPLWHMLPTCAPDLAAGQGGPVRGAVPQRGGHGRGGRQGCAPRVERRRRGGARAPLLARAPPGGAAVRAALPGLPREGAPPLVARVYPRLEVGLPCQIGLL